MVWKDLVFIHKIKPSSFCSFTILQSPPPQKKNILRERVGDSHIINEASLPCDQVTELTATSVTTVLCQIELSFSESFGSLRESERDSSGTNFSFVCLEHLLSKKPVKHYWKEEVV